MLLLRNTCFARKTGGRRSLSFTTPAIIPTDTLCAGWKTAGGGATQVLPPERNCGPGSDEPSPNCRCKNAADGNPRDQVSKEPKNELLPRSTFVGCSFRAAHRRASSNPHSGVDQNYPAVGGRYYERGSIQILKGLLIRRTGSGYQT